MEEILLRDAFEFIRTHPQMFFGKDVVDGCDLLEALMSDVRKITGFKSVIYEDDLYLIHSHTDWITEHYKSHEDFLKTVAAYTFDQSSSEFYHYGVLIYVFSSTVSTVFNGYLMNFKGRLSIERLGLIMKKYNLDEKEFYLIFSV